MRSEGAEALQQLEEGVLQATDAAVAEENAHSDPKLHVTVSRESLGSRPPGRTSADAEIVQAAVSVTKSLGLPITIFPGSTDSNVAMERGVQAVTIDGGGGGAGGHSRDETFDCTDSWKGTQRALLLVLAAAGR